LYLIRHAGKVEVEPLDLLVECANEQVASTRMDRYGGDPLGPSFFVNSLCSMAIQEAILRSRPVDQFGCQYIYKVV
jgi:hypothetical protein